MGAAPTRHRAQREGREPAKLALAGRVVEAATTDHAGYRIGRIEVPRNGIAGQAAPTVLRFAMQRADGDEQGGHEILPDFAGRVADALGRGQPAARMSGRYRADE